ncbi:MAG: COP23 domain-containing protein [Xenococcaceae cyanobacterium]
MMRKSVSIVLSATAIALGATATFSQESSQPRITFVCAPTVEPPTTFAYIQNQVTLEPVMSWYSEYLLPGSEAAELCQKVAEKLQSKYDRGQKYFLATERVDDRWKVCLVSTEGEECNSNNSEELFSLNTNYRNVHKCVMENIEPGKCFKNVSLRGTVLSTPGGGYKPSWWPF